MIQESRRGGRRYVQGSLRQCVRRPNPHGEIMPSSWKRERNLTCVKLTEPEDATERPLKKRRKWFRNVDEDNDDMFKDDCDSVCKDRIHMVGKCLLYAKEGEIYMRVKLTESQDAVERPLNLGIAKRRWSPFWEIGIVLQRQGLRNTG